MYGGGYMVNHGGPPPAPLSGGLGAPPPSHLLQHPQTQMMPQQYHHQQQQHSPVQALPMQQQQHLNLHQQQQQQHFYQQQQQQQQQQQHQQYHQQQHHAQQQLLMQQQQQQQQAVDTQLQFVAGRYRDVMRVRHDVLMLLHATPSLYPHTAAPGPGVPPLLLVSGTLPIAYKGSQYNIPIQFTIPEGYPHSPPVCKVTPTETMVVKSNHKHVDSVGICYHPYLSGWRADVCSLVGATNELKAIFAADPPVRAKPVIKHSASSPSIASATSFPAAPQSAPAPVPVYPYAPPPAYASLASAAPATNGPGSSPAAFPLPLPTYAHHQHLHGTPYPSTTTTTPTTALSAPATLFAQSPMPLPASTSVSAHQPQQQQRTQQSPARDALLSEVGKRYADLRKVVELETEKKRLTAEYKEVKKMASEIKRSNRRKEDGQVDVDTASNPRNPKDLTIMSLKAEDTAMDDALYHMMRALADETIDSATYIKHVRLLSREQFMVRAKLIKAHQQA